ncbi:DUF4085 domain-containing protein [Inconstantimicrobium mannanitabidum]|uniref:Uncharacterized protein n=1 Tax=Inconstantimicrobium mannanitabidum TaxID=1604901 RepID=A0ACB5R7C5_9CLOT|nr:DUF4085 domain-containing protein [Clostridium sp. TW13]GKX65062.1 hypothetical protein rsdtw13_03200 [Clostridium sp. TW13]
MKYFTKEWYELCQKTYAHLILEEDEQAESFSEEYFQKLYLEKLNEFLDSWRDVYKIEQEPFYKEKFSKQFEDRFIYRQEHLKKILPEKILKKIADIRVFVLDRASRQVINDVTGFCNDNEKLVDKTIKAYNKYYSEASKSFNKDMVENINFHDCLITDIKQTDEYLSILFDNSGGFTDVYEIRLENYNIIKQDASLENSWWLYDEVYKVDDKYEIHALLENKNIGLIEFTASTENISFKHN